MKKLTSTPLITIIISLIILIVISGCNEQETKRFLNNALDNPKLCNSLDGDKNIRDCYIFVAFNKKDLTICNNIQDEQQRDFCNEEVRQEANLGYFDLEFSECKSESCYEEKAKQVSDLKECDKFPVEVRHLCYYGVVVNTKNNSICDAYFVPVTENELLTQFQKLRASAILEGKPISERFNFKEIMIIQGTGNDRYSDCYNNLAWSINNSELCRGVRTHFCINTIAKQKRDQNICLQINTIRFLGAKYLDLEQESEDCVIAVKEYINEFKR